MEGLAIGGPCNPYCDTGGEPCLDLCFLKLYYLEKDVELFVCLTESDAEIAENSHLWMGTR